MDVLPSFNHVQDVEVWVREQVDLYRKTHDYWKTNDAGVRERLLMRTVRALSDESSLRAICRQLSADRPYLDYAYRHNLGFYVIYLSDPEIGFQCRLHIWMPDAPPVMEKPHRHRMGFASKILAGELRSLHYRCIGFDPSKGPPPLAEGDELHHETSINAPAEGSFDVGNTELQIRRDVVLRLCGDRTYRAGESYFFDAESIHRVCSVERHAGPSLTLTVWEPPFQPSLAYEPIGSLGSAASVRRPVMRVSEERYVELINAVRDTLDLECVEAVSG
jgi:hypothetical protein